MQKDLWLSAFAAASHRHVRENRSTVLDLGNALWPHFGELDPEFVARTEWLDAWPEPCPARWRADGAMARMEGVRRDANPLNRMVETPGVSSFPDHIWQLRLSAWIEGWDGVEI